MSGEDKNIDLHEDECDLNSQLADQSKHLQFLRKQMVHIKHQLKNQKSMRDESQLRRDQQAYVEQEERWLELEKLKNLLTAERQKCESEKIARIQLQTELEKTRSQLDKTKAIREYHMKKEEETSMLLLRLQEQSEVFHISTDCQMEEFKKKEEKMIQEVREAQHMIDRLAEELRGEKNQIVFLQQQLEEMTVSHLELNKECESAVEQSGALKQKLEMVLNFYYKTMKEDEHLILQKEELRRASAKHQLEREKNKSTDESQVEKTHHSFLVGELERLTVSHQHLSKEFEITVQQSGVLKQKLELVTELYEKKSRENQQLIMSLGAEREELNRSIQKTRNPGGTLQEQVEDVDLDNSKEDHHAFLQAGDALKDSSSVLLHQESEVKQLLPPVHRSMRMISRFLGLRRKRQNTYTY